MVAEDPRTDAELLAATATDPEAFGVFYRRHARAVLAYLLGRTGRPDLAADLCAETFASVLERAAEYDPARAPARAWLFVWARGLMLNAFRHGRVESEARRRLGIPPRDLTDRDLERVEELADLGRAFDAEALVADLPADQREAVLARVVEQRDYTDIAAELEVSEAVVRKRVSRGLTVLRARIGEQPR